MRLDGKELLRTEDICLTFHPEDGIPVKAADHVSITIHEGETFGLVGESGSGKSTLARILTHIHQPDSGKVYFEGKDVTNLKGKALRESRRAIQMVFQDPSSAFNPKERIADIICEPLPIHPGQHFLIQPLFPGQDRKSTRLNSSHKTESRMPSSA